MPIFWLKVKTVGFMTGIKPVMQKEIEEFKYDVISHCETCKYMGVGLVRATFHAVRVPMKVSGFMKGIK